jgi:glycosyltransferase involved in cell wall biosynthesis
MVKIFEYMACGLPIVLYDLVEGRRSAQDAALYATGNDPINFADQIARLLESESLRERLGTIGRIRARENLNWEVEKQKFLLAYEFCLHGAVSTSDREKRSVVDRAVRSKVEQ